MRRHHIPSVSSLLSFEDVLHSLCKLLLPPNYLFSGQLLAGSKWEWGLYQHVMMLDANMKWWLTPCKAAVSAPLLSIKVEFCGKCVTPWDLRPGHVSVKCNAKCKLVHDPRKKPRMSVRGGIEIQVDQEPTQWQIQFQGVFIIVWTCQQIFCLALPPLTSLCHWPQSALAITLKWTICNDTVLYQNSFWTMVVKWRCSGIWGNERAWIGGAHHPFMPWPHPTWTHG